MHNAPSITPSPGAPAFELLYGMRPDMMRLTALGPGGEVVDTMVADLPAVYVPADPAEDDRWSVLWYSAASSPDDPLTIRYPDAPDASVAFPRRQAVRITVPHRQGVERWLQSYVLGSRADCVLAVELWKIPPPAYQVHVYSVMPNAVQPEVVHGGWDFPELSTTLLLQLQTSATWGRGPHPDGQLPYASAGYHTTVTIDGHAPAPDLAVVS